MAWCLVKHKDFTFYFTLFTKFQKSLWIYMPTVLVSLSKVQSEVGTKYLRTLYIDLRPSLIFEKGWGEGKRKENKYKETEE
jgi:hypothetical protein